MKQRWLVLLSCCLSLLALPSMATNLVNFKIESKSSYWRLHFALDGATNYRAFVLSHPNRVVLDISGIKRYKSFPKWLWQGSPVTKIRAAKHANKLRVVLDLQYPVKLQSNLLQYNKHHVDIVLDLLKKNSKVTGFTWPSKTRTLPSTFVQAKPLRSVLPKRSRQIIIVIDPGHGGKDPGATGPHGLHEKTVVLAIAKKLAKMINSRVGFKAYLTRTRDHYLTLRQRLAIARRDKADMFIAIHADAFKDTTATGASVFALSQRGATSEAARWIAERENKSELMGGVNLSDKSHVLKSVLISLSQNASVKVSLQIGNAIIDALSSFSALHHHKVEQAAFVVLKSPDIPSLLVETGFITNPREERRLASSYYQWKLARAMKRGIESYFLKHPPANTWIAMQRNNPRKLVRRYRVVRGDTLSHIASQFNSSIISLIQYNHLRSSRIAVGQELLIPAQRG